MYATFSNPVRLAKWWEPKGFTNKFETFEFKLGGDWAYTMIGPDGHFYQNKRVFGELVPREKFVILHIATPRFTLTVSPIPGDGVTQVKWVEEFEDPKVAAAARHIAEPGM